MKTYANDLRDEFLRGKSIAVDLVELYLLSQDDVTADTVRLCTGGFNIDYNSNTYTAQGDFIGFSTVSEDFDVKVGKFSIYLSGVDNTLVNKFTRTHYEGRRVVIRKAFLDFQPMTLNIIDQPMVIFDGTIYNVSITESAVTCAITVECSTLWADFERTNGRKTNNGSNWLFQGAVTDTAFEKSGYVGNTEFKWGKI